MSELRQREIAHRNRWVAVCMAVVALTASLICQTTAGASRITKELSANTVSSVKIPGSVHSQIKLANDLGAVNAEMPMESLTLNIGPSAAQQKDLDTLLSAQQNPRSPQYRQWLTQEQFGARFGLTDADLAKITSWLKGRGFAVKNIAPSRNMITFSGTAAQVETAFQTQIHEYELEGAKHISNATEISIPASLAGVVTHVGGLSSFRPRPHLIRRPASPEFTSSISGTHSLSPGDWATIYGVNAIYQAGVTGTGMHVGVVGETYFPTTDVDKFRAAAGLDAAKLTMFCISSANCTDAAGEEAGEMDEADLDVEWAGGIAKEATVDFIYASAADSQQDVISALIYAINTYKVSGAVVPVISMSYGACEFEITASEKTSWDAYLSQAATQGQTIVNSAGDEGGACTSTNVSTVTNGLNVSWPASSPYVTGVGGTEFDGDGTITDPDTYSDAYWNSSTTTDIVSSAIKYIPETSWNDTTYDQSISSSATLSSGGGGVSTLYSHPSWQATPSGYTGTSMRFVPDVAFSASADHDPYLICTQVFTGSVSQGSSCVNGFRYSDQTLLNSYIGGTSASTPSFAGLLTLIVQSAGEKLGNINSMLYSLAGTSNYATVFNDITTGTNKQPCTAGTGTGCSGGLAGYSSGTGYDLVTGLGSVNGSALNSAMTNLANLTATTTSVSASSSSVTIGGTDVLTATVTPSAATGTVTFQVRGTTLGTSTLSGGTATLGVNVTAANGFIAGTDAITATYGGDGTTYAASSGTASLTVAAQPAYTLTGGASTLSVGAGSSGTVSLTLTSTNYAGTVTFATVVTSANGTPSDVTASASSVTLASGATGTSTLTISPNSSARSRTPRIPWKSGGVVFAVLLGAPLTVRKKRLIEKRAIAVLLAGLAITAAGMLMSCSGGGSRTPRTYVVTVTPSGSGTVTNPSAMTITVTVP